MAGARVSIRALGKSYGEVRALDSVSLEINSGEMLALIGPDGAGKTTLMRIICSLIDADEGDVEINGLSVKNEPSKVRAMIGYMPQRFSLYPDLTVMENIRFFADIFGVPRSKQGDSISRLLSFSRLDRFIDRKAGELSGGMKQKLALSCVLIHDPALLVLDEPTTGVDPVSRREFLKMLDELRKMGTTILLSTPYMNEAEMCDRGAFIYGGSILAAGTIEKLNELFDGSVLEIVSHEGARLAGQIKEVVPSRYIQVLGDRVKVVIPSGQQEMRDALIRELSTVGIERDAVREVEPNLEDTFVYLLSRG